MLRFDKDTADYRAVPFISGQGVVGCYDVLQGVVTGSLFVDSMISAYKEAESSSAASVEMLEIGRGD